MQEHEKTEEARQTFLDKFNEAGDKFMAVLIEPIDGGDGVTCFRTTFDFPKDMRLLALRELLNTFVQEDEQGKPAPLPFAPFLLSREQFESLKIKPVQATEEETKKGEPDVICG